MVETVDPKIQADFETAVRRQQQRERAKQHIIDRELEKEDPEISRTTIERTVPSKPNSELAPMKPAPRRAGGRGPPIQTPTRSPVSRKLTENRVPKNTPTSLEQVLSFEGEGKGVHEVLGVLVDAHKKEAEAILGRTNILDREDAITVGDIFTLAKHGIGGDFDEPLPFVSEWALNVLQTLPSVGGKSRIEFVEAWSSAEKERARAQAEAEKRDRRIS
jgi:hypothetical protein